MKVRLSKYISYIICFKLSFVNSFFQKRKNKPLLLHFVLAVPCRKSWTLEINVAQHKSASCIVSAPSPLHKQYWVTRSLLKAGTINTVHAVRDEVIKYSKNLIYIVRDCPDVACFIDLVMQNFLRTVCLTFFISETLHVQEFMKCYTGNL